jgi:hypothetical protein
MSEQLESDLFRLRLAQAIAHCSRQMPFIWDSETGLQPNALRCSDLRPPAFSYWEPVSDMETVKASLSLKSPPEIRAIIDHLCEQRAIYLSSVHIECSPATGLAGGRLLFYNPYENLSDGAAEAETSGFFDADNCPAWETWVHFVYSSQDESDHLWWHRAYLISWVPPQLVELVDKGINVNPEECIHWAEDVDEPFVEELGEMGLLGQSRGAKL